MDWKNEPWKRAWDAAVNSVAATYLGLENQRNYFLYYMQNGETLALLHEGRTDFTDPLLLLVTGEPIPTGMSYDQAREWVRDKAGQCPVLK